MKWYQRAWAYVSRKRVRVGLLFIILSLITTGVLAVLALQVSTQAVQDRLLSLSNTGFQLTSQTADGRPQGELDALASISGLVNPQFQTDNLARFQSGQVIQAQQAIQRDQDDDGLKQLLSIQGRQASDTDLDFASGALTLTQGRHLTADDHHKVLLHEQLAQANGLHVGDRVTLQGLQLTEQGQAQSGETIEAEIVGLYNGKRSETFTGLSSDLTENRLYLDYASSQELLGRAPADYRLHRAQYQVTNPQDLATIVSQVQSLPLDWTQWQLTSNRQAFDQVAAPIASFQSLMTLMTGAVLLVSVLTLFLILLFCLRERVHEFGILLSLGISKGQIIGQIGLELWGLSLGAWGLAALGGYPLARSFYSQLIVANDLPETVRRLFEAALPTWQGSLVLASYGLVLLILIVAILASAGLVLAKKPREILGQLS